MFLACFGTKGLFNDKKYNGMTLNSVEKNRTVSHSILHHLTLVSKIYLAIHKKHKHVAFYTMKSEGICTSTNSVFILACYGMELGEWECGT
jgi:hypothetical protein